MMSFKKWDNLTAWVVFAISLSTYVLTMEPTASFWDCGEFIACAFKLQVPHPPGAPLFLLIGRLFSLLALGNAMKVAYWVNMVSVISSAFTVFFLFKTISLLARKVIGMRGGSVTSADAVLVNATAAVGALAYAWSDSFWFSAVEAEVYGLSSFFTAVVIWAAFKWETIDDPATANRWLILTAYLIGLSIGVHLLNLVTIPALALVYYFKKYQKPTFLGTSTAFLAGLSVLGIIDVGIIPGLPGLAGQFEIFFVNSLGLPYNTGIAFFALAFLGGLIWAIRQSHRANRPLLNTALLAFAFVLVGYCSYAVVLVRSGYNPPINENNPSDVLRFVYYLKREQYESRPLLYGPSFNTRPVSQERGAPLYAKKDGKYVLVDHKPIYRYDPGSQMPFPRLSSSQPGHAQLYRQMLGLAEGEKPTMRHNLWYLFSHQLGHMYWRYLFWNFAGRESDQEGAGTVLPWQLAGSLPTSISSNRAHTNFLMLPFLLGIAGVVYLYYSRRKELLVLGLLFALTGVALVVYLNSPPSEPRERDYIYVGSFYIFCIWIGFGVMAIARLLERAIAKRVWQAGIAGLVSLSVPGIMVGKGWDSHDRSGRYHSVDFARNLLNSCAPNAILFTGGDNDTFPLWYLQEVEGFRTDVRVCVQTFLGADWYIEQLRRRINQSEGLPLSLDSGNYQLGKNEYLPFYEIASVKNGINLKEYLELVRQNNQAIQVPLTSGETTSILPSSTVFLPVDTAAVGTMNLVKRDLMPYLSDSMSWKIGENDLLKGDLVMLDIIASNNWKRPVYFSSTMGSSHNLGLQEYFQLEGYAYRLLPVRVPGASDGYVNSDLMYDNLMNKMQWRGMNDPKVYYDDTYRGLPVFTARLSFLRLAQQLIAEQKIDKARKVVDRAMAVMPDDTIPYDQVSAGFIGALFDVGENQKALDSARAMALRSDENLSWIQESKQGRNRDVNTDLFILQSIVRDCRRAKQHAEADRYEAIFKKHLNAFHIYGG